MKLSAIAPLLMALAAITSANPLEERAEETAVTGAPDEASANVEADPEIKAASRPINLVVWKKPNFTGERVQLHPPSGACRNFKPGLDNAVSSLNTNGAVCRFWKQRECRGELLAGVVGRRAKLGNFDNSLSSYRCS